MPNHLNCSTHIEYISPSGRLDIGDVELGRTLASHLHNDIAIGCTEIMFHRDMFQVDKCFDYFHRYICIYLSRETRSLYFETQL